jgi:NADPH-dependent curcumin reductase CurA
MIHSNYRQACRLFEGLTVIGFVGSDEKCHWLTNEHKFDYVFNYKLISLDEALKQAAPNGVDIFFDNVRC